MKIRHGFVSNSSSSSFCVIVSEEDHQEIIKDFHPYHQAFLNAVMTPADILGRKARWFMQTNDWAGSGRYYPLAENAYFEYDGELPELGTMNEWWMDKTNDRDKRDKTWIKMTNDLMSAFWEYEKKLYKSKKEWKAEISNSIRGAMYGFQGGVNVDLYKKFIQKLEGIEVSDKEAWDRKKEND